MDTPEERARRRVNEALMPGTAFAEETFSPVFMSEHTQFSSFGAMCDAVGVKTAQQFRALPPDQWEAHVRANTKFASWDEMKIRAGAEMIARRVRRGSQE